VSIVDRQEGGHDAMIDAGLELYSLFTLDDLL
jgi:orotate phosphoribosyltransferase